MRQFGLRLLLKKIKKEIMLSQLNAEWRKKNPHNKSALGEICNISDIEVGKGTYGRLTVYDFGYKEDERIKLKIGNYCSIARGVVFLTAGEHYINRVSTFPFRSQFINEEPESKSKGPIVIGDDVWIGHGAIILSGVNISQGAVIAAGSVVNIDVPPYAIVGGVPAKIIKYRFDDVTIDKLLKIDYSLFDEKFIEKHIDLLEMPALESIEKILTIDYK